MMRGNSQNLMRLLLLLWLLGAVTVGLQSWVGDKTIYAPELAQKREAFHYGILANEAPGGKGWGAIGGLTVQKRVGVVYLAEGVRRVTNLSVRNVYKVLDSLFLFIALVALFFFLRRWVPDTFALIGTLYFCAVLPLTYFFQLFHPWDRLQLAIWIGLLSLVADRRFLPLVVSLALSIVVKFDTVMLPGFYFLVHSTQDRWRRTSVETLVLLVVGFGTYIAIGQLFPAPLDKSGFTSQNALVMLEVNARRMLDMNVRYPPFLVHALPVGLSLLQLRRKPRFVVASVVFALGLTAVYLLFSYFEEVRSHLIVLVLVLPSALISVRHLFTADDTGDPPHRLADRL